MVFRGVGCIAGETQAGFSCGFSPFPSHMVLYRCHTSPSFVRFCTEIVMKINTDPQPLDSKVDATGEDLPSGGENVALSAFCFYGFLFFWCKEICFRGYFQLAWHQRAREWQRKLGSLFLSIPQIIFCSYCSQIPLLLTLVRVDSKVCHWDPSSMTWTNIAGKKGIKPVSLLQDFSEPFK